MRTTAWHGGPGTYAIYIGKPNRERYFKRDWETVAIELGGLFHNFAITEGFWNECPEIRDRGKQVIREWLSRRYSLKWPRGQPLAMDLLPLGNGRFRLVTM